MILRSKTKNSKNTLKKNKILRMSNKTILMLLKNNLKFSKRKISCLRKDKNRTTKLISSTILLNYKNVSQNSIKIKNYLFKTMIRKTK